ncbi:Putative GNAT domain, acyl-CoA N-acyltransferase [Septoria linicola]|uniref:GNAT domain, acyl-CoA N-acyltransferase n=1 Tax=Septoria linicola TaxID=215465 RepID=A0A9Q9AM57_9PEZI|nr:putative GNAT domain, acyl-CoA N-acyltransferase [Septoria linicola]USW50619.1 Putative GNAT domain, acyl-CoA N-acyltransferase [Septoria linicola]
MAVASTKAPLEIWEATLAEVPSLSTIVPRAFHPVNPYIRKCHPDTPAVRQWWSKIFADEITSPDCHVLIAYDSTADPATQVAGILCLRLMQADDLSGGFWSLHPFTQDQDAVLFQGAMDAMLEGRKKAFTSPSEYAGKKNYLVELFGVDEKYKGQGLARKLLQAAGDIADDAGLVTFVEANASAAPVYAKLGYMEQGTVEMPGPNGVYVEHLMIRPVAKQ